MEGRKKEVVFMAISFESIYIRLPIYLLTCLIGHHNITITSKDNYGILKNAYNIRITGEFRRNKANVLAATDIHT